MRTIRIALALAAVAAVGVTGISSSAAAPAASAQDEADIVVGAIFDRNLDGKFRVSVVATGLDGASAGTQPRQGVALGQDMQTRTLQ